MIDTIQVLLTIEVDTETSESKVVKREVLNPGDKPKRSTSSSKTFKDDGDPVAKIILEENKYQLNAAAVKLMGVEPDNRLDIKFQKINGASHPIIGTDDTFGTKGGNRLTKSFTVSCKGKNRDKLVMYGEVFTLTPHTTEGLFVMNGDKEVIQDVEDTNIEVPEDNTEIDIDLDMSAFAEEGDSVSPIDFNFNI